LCRKFVNIFNLFLDLFLGNRIIGPIIFDENLNGQRYLEILQNQIIPAIRENIPEHHFNTVWFQQDGCPAHNTREVREFLHQNFGDRVISNSGPVLWPARSPDITPLDFYLWGHVKNEIYEFEPPETRQILEERTRETFTFLNQNTISKVVRTVLRKCQKCIESNGRHFKD